MSIANRDEAEKCQELAMGFLQNRQYDKAIRFFDKAIKLYPDLPNVRYYRDKAVKLQSDSSSNSSSSSSSSNSNNNNSSNRSSNFDKSSSNGSNTQSSNSSTRGFTAEQESGAKQIVQYSKTSHYKVLNISKSASAAEVR